MGFSSGRPSPLTLLSVLTFSVSLTQAASPNPDEKQWSVESVPETKLFEKRVKLVLRISPQSVVLRPKKLGATEIPVAAIVRVGYDETAHSKGWTWWNASNSQELDGKNNPFSVLEAPLLVGAAIAAPFKTRQHYIHILWQKDSEPQEIAFEAGKGDYQEILAELQSVTGKSWQDLPSERQKLREEIDHAKGRTTQLQIDREILVTGTELKPGTYQLVLLDRGQSLSEAYFCAGSEAHSDRVAAQAFVRVERSAAAQRTDPKSREAAPPEMVFAEQAGENSLSELRFPEETLHFNAPSFLGFSGNLARVFPVFSSGGNRWAIVRSTVFNGEPALSFRVLHSEFRPCAEMLYVTRTRVAMEPMPTSDSHCTGFSAPREEVKAQAPAGILIAAYLEFKWKEKSYRFQPLFESRSDQATLPGIGSQQRAAAHEFGEFFVRAVEDFDAVERETQSAAAPKTLP